MHPTTAIMQAKLNYHGTVSAIIWNDKISLMWNIKQV